MGPVHELHLQRWGGRWGEFCAMNNTSNGHLAYGCVRGTDRTWLPLHMSWRRTMRSRTISKGTYWSCLPTAWLGRGERG